MEPKFEQLVAKVNETHADWCDANTKLKNARNKCPHTIMKHHRFPNKPSHNYQECLACGLLTK